MFTRKTSGRHQPIGGLRHLFHGVAVKAPDTSDKCAASAAIEGRRFLSDEAPSLPLVDCTMPRSCKCVYEHFNDRRTEKRRDSDFGLPARYHGVDRRVQKKRRVTDRE